MATPSHRTNRLLLRSAVAVAAATLILLAGCGSDGDAPTATTEATTTSATATSAFPSEAFCAAQADLDSAQDGAQRNTAIGEMQSSLGEDAPAEISNALDTLLEGDLTPDQYTEAEQALAEACS